MTSSHPPRPYTHQRARQMLTLQGLSQNADHLAHNSPFLACFAEVVCDLGTSSLALDHHAGENGDTRTLTCQKNAPHAAKPLRFSCGSAVNTQRELDVLPTRSVRPRSWLPTFNTDFPVPTCRKIACQQHVVSYTPRIGLGTRAECPVRFVARQGFAYVLPEEPGGARPTACCRRCRRRSQGIGWYCRPK